MKVYFFSNGNTAVTDEDGKQVPELQVSWFKFYLTFLEELGYDPTTMEFDFQGTGKAEIFKTDEDEWNWEFGG